MLIDFRPPVQIRAILEKPTDLDFLRFVPIVFRKNGLAPLYYKPFQKYFIFA
ncbi:hypothetical protein LEP1GSC039_2525 [Leptospira santarosai str. 2000027870]|nr:hypothetical protein LEP1GSC039_2525 [Leptospira santarosai str. 2000027870]